MHRRAAASANFKTAAFDRYATPPKDERDAEENDPDELVLRAVAARGLQPNLTYVAFTATPKARTIELFGTRDGKQIRPFHLYSMRQAIDEGFILDVLRTYVTYTTYYKVARAISDNDPLVDRAKAAQAIARFVSLHAANFAQRAEVIVEHVRRDTITKINGRAKAMVVTRSRLHAVRMKQAIDRYISEKGYDLRACVAFSGTVEADGLRYTEPQMNNGIGVKQFAKEFVALEPDSIRPGQLRQRFHIMVVAEKYQTGYDEPLLHSMFVDKRLGGLKAVQTLSRLNRSHPAKKDTFILDFVNTADEIQDAFKPYYEATMAQPTDPNLLYTVRDRVLAFDVVAQPDIVAFARALAGGAKGAHAKLYGHTDAAMERYKALEQAAQLGFRQAAQAYVRLYGFLAQIVPFADIDLERLYVYVKALLSRVPEEREAAIDLGDQVTLTHLRTELTGRHALSLNAGEGELRGFPGGGRGPQHVGTQSPLSEIIDFLNTRFGTNFGPADALYFEQMLEEMLSDEDLAREARANTVDNFLFGFARAFDGRIIERRELNEQIFARVMEDKDFSALLKDLLGKRMYDMVRAGDGKHN